MEDRYLIFNVGTSGLPTDGNFDTCRLVQIVWTTVTLSDYEKKKQVVNKIIKPDKFKISKGSINIHGITQDYAKVNGVKCKEVLLTFYNDLKDCQYIVSHNLEFGFNVLENESTKYDNKLLVSELNNMKKICLGTSSKNLLKLKTTYSDNYKMPRLGELYEWCFDKKMTKYNVIYNFSCMVKIFYYLMNKCRK